MYILRMIWLCVSRKHVNYMGAPKLGCYTVTMKFTIRLQWQLFLLHVLNPSVEETFTEYNNKIFESNYPTVVLLNPERFPLC